MVNCEYAPEIGNSNGGDKTLSVADIYNVLVEMINPENKTEKPVPAIHLFDISTPLSDEALKSQSRVSCNGNAACPQTVSQITRSKHANCVKQTDAKDFKPGDATSAESKAVITKLVAEQGAFNVYGTYELKKEDCGEAKVNYGYADNDIGGQCRVKGVSSISSGVYWQTTWRSKEENRIVVTYTASKLISEHGADDVHLGWNWMDTKQTMKRGLVTRSALNALRVQNMKLKPSSVDDMYMLCGAHRLNFKYHTDRMSATSTGFWGEGTFITSSDNILDRLKKFGLATPSLFDPLGLVWILLWKTDDAKYYVCAAHMHPHFADLITGLLPENYNVCTATRWWNSGDDVGNWFNSRVSAALDAPTIRNQMKGSTDYETDWVADKIRKPFFRLEDGEVKNGSEVARALYTEESRAGTTRPLKWLIDVLKYVYFDKSMPIATTKPVPVVTAAITMGPAGPPAGSSVT
ncbi:MAG: hypothetical protein EBZ77_15500, partial [Chitinophagia bacterium]|nr:hypothetical protein [Chitinophagia bacterium]